MQDYAPDQLPRRSAARRWPWLLLVGLLLALAAVALWQRDALLGAVQQYAAEETATEQPAPAPQPAPAIAQVRIEGFRSAKFGMSEEEVLQSIAVDFDIPDNGLKIYENEQQGTKILQFRTLSLLPETQDFVSVVSYILGAKERRLIQVNLVWSTRDDPRLTFDLMRQRAAQLRQGFLREGLVPASITTYGRTAEGWNIVLEGEDAEGRSLSLRTIVLRHDDPEADTAIAGEASDSEPASGEDAASEEGQAGEEGGEEKPAAKPDLEALLLLSFIEDRGAPDVLAPTQSGQQ